MEKNCVHVKPKFDIATNFTPTDNISSWLKNNTYMQCKGYAVLIDIRWKYGKIFK